MMCHRTTKQHELFQVRIIGDAYQIGFGEEVIFPPINSWFLKSPIVELRPRARLELGAQRRACYRNILDVSYKRCIIVKPSFIIDVCIAVVGDEERYIA